MEISSTGVEPEPLRWLREVETAVRRRGTRLPRQEVPQELWSGMGFHVAAAPVVIALREVRELVYCPRVTRIPGCRAWVKGLANVRGRLLTVVDLSGFLAGQATPVTPRSRVLAVRDDAVPVGLLLGAFVGLRHFGVPRDTGPPPQPPWLAPYTRGQVDDGQRVWNVLDTERLLSTPDFLRIAL